VKGTEEVFVEGSVKDSWKGGREGETEGNWKKPEKKRRKKVKANMMVIVIVLMGLGGTTSMVGLVWWFLCLCLRERK
jgi:hypothetical protein